MHVELSSRARTTAYLELFEQQANPKPVIIPEGLAMQPPELAVSNTLGPVERSSSVTRACYGGVEGGAVMDDGQSIYTSFGAFMCGY